MVQVTSWVVVGSSTEIANIGIEYEGPVGYPEEVFGGQVGLGEFKK